MSTLHSHNAVCSPFASTKVPSRRALAMLCTAMLFTVTACSDSVTATGEGAAETLIADAMNSIPVGFSATENTFADAENDSWRPRRQQHRGRRGPFGAAFGVGFMGGGLGADFSTGAGFHQGVSRGPFGGGFRADFCSYEPASGKIVCGPTTSPSGLTVERWVLWTDVDGATQRAPDSTTHSMQTHAEVYGTVPMRDSATRTVRHVSDRLVTGLEKGSPERTVNGVSHGTETVNGFVRGGAFLAEREVSDSTRSLVIPVRGDGRTYPIAGMVVRTMKVAVTVDGGETETAEWKEVLTYDGSATATLVITRNGESKTCTVPLPAGRPVCP